MKIFSSALITETNTFSGFETTMESFEEFGIVRCSIARDALGSVGEVVEQWRNLAARHGDVLIEGLYALAQPAGPVRRADYEKLRTELLDAVQAAMPLDVVLLYLHGAMVAEDEDDCEGDLIRAVRKIVGPRCAIGVELDPHCHLSPAMTQGASAIVLMREYPHTDFAERAVELFELCRAAAGGMTRPEMVVVDCRLVGFYPTTSQPMRGLVDALAQAESLPGILSASLVHGFPWGDVADAGSKVLVIADGNRALAREVAQRLARSFYRLRHALMPKLETMDRALRDLPEDHVPRILADVGDNPGGGAPCDHTLMLAELLARQDLRSAVGMICDPQSVQACMAAGIGSALRVRIGGKAGESSGGSLEIDCKVLGLAEQHTQQVGRIIDQLGRAAWIRSGTVDIVLISRRTQTLSPTGFTNLGVPLHEARVIGVKSSHHYYAEFSKLSKDCRAVETGAALSMDFARLPYRKRDPNYFPAVDNPAPELS